MSLTQSVFVLYSTGGGTLDAYASGGLKMVFYVPWLLVFVETQRRDFLNSILPQPSNLEVRV
jgi:hypothetical protein